MKENPMRKIEIEKVIVNAGGSGDKLTKALKLLNLITGKKVKKNISKKRIPSFDVHPGLETGCMVTIRNKGEIQKFLKRVLESVNNKIKKENIAENHFSFGIEEYIQIPEMEYQRDIGMLGLEISVVFKRKGKRVKMRKIKCGKYPKRQNVSAEEIIEFLRKMNVEVEENDSQ